MRSPIVLLVLLIILSACGGEPTPIYVMITTTPEPTVVQELSGDGRKLAGFPGPSPTPQAASPTSTATVPLTDVPSSVTPTLAPPVLPDVPSPHQLPVLDQSRMGIQVHPNIDATTWNTMIQTVDYLELEWVKVQVPWREIERSPGQYNLTTYIRRIRAINEAAGPNRQVLVSFTKAPDWARPAGADLGTDGPPANPADLVNFIRIFINAVHPIEPYIDAIEVWNEPNLAREWNGIPMDGGTYMTYFDAVYTMIRAEFPHVTVLTAGLAPGDVPGIVTNDRLYLQQMYAAGLARHQDVGIGVHPYGWANPPDERCCSQARPWADNPVFFFQDTLYDYHDIVQHNGHNAKLWVTEFGWGTYRGVGPGGTDVVPPPDDAEFFGYVTPEQQAQYTVRALELMQQSPLGDFVERAFLWNLNFAMLAGAMEQRTEQAGYSLLDASGYPRLVFHYLSTARRN